MKHLITLTIIINLLFSQNGQACSMYKLTKDGKTIVGNNEDYISPNSMFWFEKATKNKNGVMYMGLLDKFAQGAINDKGLVFDGFWEPFLEVKNTQGKLETPIQEAIKRVMQTMTKVEEVHEYLNQINLKDLQNGQLVFIDKTGKYLIIEGDEMFTGDEAEKTFSNFYYSQIQSLEDVTLPYFKKGQEFINTTKHKQNLGYCSEAMSHFSQSGIAPTQYTTIYDLENLTIRVHLFQDFENYIELDLKSELKKDNHQTMISSLFPKDSKGVQHYTKYNNPERPTLLLEELLGNHQVTEEELVSQGFNHIINKLGYEWLKDIKNTDGAIKVFSYGIKLMPNNASLYDGLGEAYFEQKDWTKALINYAKSLSLNPDNKNAIKMIVEINALREGE
jgi:tetratricopeptide (TPR) repeat protein